VAHGPSPYAGLAPPTDPVHDVVPSCLRPAIVTSLPALCWPARRTFVQRLFRSVVHVNEPQLRRFARMRRVLGAESAIERTPNRFWLVAARPRPQCTKRSSVTFTCFETLGDTLWGCASSHSAGFSRVQPVVRP